jgi:hypothetical protein
MRDFKRRNRAADPSLGPRSTAISSSEIAASAMPKRAPNRQRYDQISADT